jgi:hypothetical protein
MPAQKATKQMKVEYLKNNFRDLDSIKSRFITYVQYKAIEECLLASGFYEGHQVDPSTIDSLVIAAKGETVKRRFTKRI